jgi:hypothetical protein
LYESQYLSSGTIDHDGTPGWVEGSAENGFYILR